LVIGLDGFKSLAIAQLDYEKFFFLIFFISNTLDSNEGYIDN
jgi:hypothetical protein